MLVVSVMVCMGGIDAEEVYRGSAVYGAYGHCRNWREVHYWEFLLLV